MKRIAVIGAGAAGCFCTAQLMRSGAPVSVDVYEAGSTPLAKVALTGGGRCNLTNTFEGIRSLPEVYPRGDRIMKRLLKQFSPEDTQAWFESAGVPLVCQDDQCVFPRSQSAMDVVRALLREMSGARIHCNKRVERVSPGYSLSFQDGTTASADVVIVTTGGAPKGLPLLDGLDLEWVPTVPSLFTFRIADEKLHGLMGIVTEAIVSIPGTPFSASGPLLITDWGLSGPAALKLSSYAARYLSEAGYKAPLSVNWLSLDEADTRHDLESLSREHPRKQVVNSPPAGIQARLWEYLVQRAGIRPDIRWAELGTKGTNRLVATLMQDGYSIGGKTKFREEFVTCGGVALSNIQPSSLESKKYPGLYFAGEVLDIDAVTGGFNLQAAWSSGYAVAQSIAAK